MANRRRYVMPQINNIDHYLNWLDKKLDCKAKKDDSVDASELKPTQGELDQKKVDSLASDLNRPYNEKHILADQSGRILDGHHRWAAAKKNNDTLKVAYIQMPIDEIIDQTRAKYPGVSYKKLGESTMIESFKEYVNEKKQRNGDDEPITKEYDDETKSKVEVGKKKTKVEVNPTAS